LNSKCDPSENTINLILWFDSSSFRKTGKAGKIWSMLAMIGDLDPQLRTKLHNLLTIFHLGNGQKNFLNNN
jgi:hypothetical protein